MAIKGNDMRIRCSFCGKTEDQVHKLIAGPDGAYICDECVEICSEIIQEEMEEEYAQVDSDEINLMKPKEIKAFLDEYVIGQDEAKKRFPWLFTIIINVCSPETPPMWSCRRAIF